MTYVSDQTSAQLRSHMKKLVRLPGWNDPLSTRLWKEIQEQDARLDGLLEALKDLLHQAEQSREPWWDYEQARAAIAKATGEVA